MKRILVVLLSFNKEAMVLQCLASLHEHPHPDCTVLVFDNASSDGSPQAIASAYPLVELVCSDVNLGAVRGRNAAVAHASRSRSFDYILFLDDDAEVLAHGVRRLAEALDVDSSAGIAAGKTYISSSSNTIMSTGITQRLHLARCGDRGAGEEDSGQFDTDGYVDACGAFAFMIRAWLFHELGGFDPVFSPYGWEEVDLCLRARTLGHLTRYVHEARFVHKGTRLGRKPVPGYERAKARNFMILLYRHTGIAGKMSAALLLPLRALLLVLRFASQGHWKAIAAQFRGVSDFLQARHR